MQRIKRLEAGDSSQARGMDTQAMLPVLAMVAELIAMLGFRWVSVPDLRYWSRRVPVWIAEEPTTLCVTMKIKMMTGGY